MRKPLLSLTILAVLCSALACNKKSNTPAPQKIDDVVYVSYSKMAPGNYWVYNLYQLDSNYKVLSQQTGTDSFYVEKDTVIRGNTFHKYWQPKTMGSQDYTFTYLRDSLQYLVDDKSTIYFESQDYNKVLYTMYQKDPSFPSIDTSAVIQVKMTDKDSTEVTPAGKFVTSNLEWDFTMNEFYWKYAPAVRKCSRRYSAGVGMVSEVPPITYSISSTYHQRQLARYHVQ